MARRRWVRVLLAVWVVGTLASLLLAIRDARRDRPAPVAPTDTGTRDARPDSAALTAVLTSAGTRVVIRSTSVLSDDHPWRSMVPRDAQPRRPHEYWVFPTAAAQLHWMPVYPGPRYEPTVTLTDRHYLVRGYGTGDETRLAELLLRHPVVSFGPIVSGLPTVQVEDSAAGVHFVGEAGVLSTPTHLVWVDRVVATEPCDSGPDACRASTGGRRR